MSQSSMAEEIRRDETMRNKTMGNEKMRNETLRNENSKNVNCMSRMGGRFLASLLLLAVAGLGANAVGSSASLQAGVQSSSLLASDVVYGATVSEDEAEEILKAALMETWDQFGESLSMSSIGLKGIVTAEMFDEVYTELIRDNYQYFYVSEQTDYKFYSSGATDYVTTAYFDYEMTESEAKTALTKLEAAIETALDGVEASWSDLEKVIYFHDYLTRLCEYDTTYSNYSIYNALVDNSAVCQGYAVTFHYLLSTQGISSEFVSSQDLNHVWNVVKLNGSWYMVDVTWDDPTNPDRLGRSNHKYFLKSASAFMADSMHTADDWTFTGGLTASDVASNYYDEYFWNSVTTGFEYVDGKWYGLNGTTIYTYTCNGKSMVQGASVATISSKWKVWGMTSAYWSGCYTSLASFDGALYYSTADAIYMYVPSTGKTTEIYELDDEAAAQGYIYGMRVTADSTLEFYVAESPSEDGAADAYTAFQLPYVDTDVDLAECEISLSETSYTYTGSAKKPSVTVKYDGANLKKGTDYTVSYSNNTNAGTASVTITGKGDYKGTVTKTFTIAKASQTLTATVVSSTIVKGNTTQISASGTGTITYSSANTSVATVSSSGKVTGKGYGTVEITVKAAGNANYKSATKTISISVQLKTPSISSVTNTSTGIQVKWGSVSGAVKYRVYRRTSTTASWKKLADTTSTSYIDTTAKNGTNYYYTVRCITSGGTSTSSYSSTGKSCYRLSSPTLSSVSCTAAKTLTVSYKKNSSATGYQIQYSTSSSFSSVAKTYTITKNSTLSQKISGLTKGKTYYVRVRAYKTVSGTKYYSGWTSTSKKVTK